jgi:microcystin-dependent protein
MNHDHPATQSGGISANHTHYVGNFHGENSAANWCFANGGGRCFNVFDAVNSGTVSSDHSHSVDIPNFTGSTGDGGFANSGHNNMQPTMVMNYIIKV